MPVLLGPVFHGAEDLLGLGLVADEIVVHEVHVASMPQSVEHVEFGDDLLRGLCSWISAVELDDVAELAVERAASGELNSEHKVIVELQQVETGNGAPGHVRLFGRRIGPAARALRKGGEEGRER